MHNSRFQNASATIASGVISVGMFRSVVTVDTEAAAASDDLDTISGGKENQIITLIAANSARTVVVKNGTGNIVCGSDFSLDHANDRIKLQKTGSSWYSVSEKSNG